MAAVILSTRPAAAQNAIPAPGILARTFLVTSYGAVGDGKTLNTAALQKALDVCAQAGGGTVNIPAGRFLTGPLTLGSALNLHLQSGATLLMSDDPAQFPVMAGRYQDCLTAHDAHDVALTGDGTIDGQGAYWWAHDRKSGPHRSYRRPRNRPQHGRAGSFGVEFSCHPLHI